MAHNGQFDVRVSKHAAEKSKESIDSSTVVGFCDSKELFKRKFPDMKPYTQEALADRFLHEKYDAHEATSDVKILKKLVNMNFTDEDIRKYTEKFESSWYRVNYNDNKAHNLASFPVEEMKAHGISESMVGKMAGSGLRLKHLYIIYKRGGQDELLEQLRKKNFTGKVRVTNRETFLNDCMFVTSCSIPSM